MEENIIANLAAWLKWAKSEAILDVNPPEPFGTFDTFEKMMLVKIFRPEKLYQCSGVYVK